MLNLKKFISISFPLSLIIVKGYKNYEAEARAMSEALSKKLIDEAPSKEEMSRIAAISFLLRRVAKLFTLPKNFAATFYTSSIHHLEIKTRNVLRFPRPLIELCSRIHGVRVRVYESGECRFVDGC
jgi:hypothetical protein